MSLPQKERAMLFTPLQIPAGLPLQRRSMARPEKRLGGRQVSDGYVSLTLLYTKEPNLFRGLESLSRLRETVE